MLTENQCGSERSPCALESSGEAPVARALPLEDPGYVTSQDLPPSPQLHDPNLQTLICRGPIRPLVKVRHGEKVPKVRPRLSPQQPLGAKLSGLSCRGEAQGGQTCRQRPRQTGRAQQCELRSSLPETAHPEGDTCIATHEPACDPSGSRGGPRC